MLPYERCVRSVRQPAMNVSCPSADAGSVPLLHTVASTLCEVITRLRVVRLRKALDEVVRVCQLCRLLHLRERHRVRVADLQQICVQLVMLAGHSNCTIVT